MFSKNNFTPIGGQTNRLAPTLFSYSNEKDSLLDILGPGYFNSRRTMFRRGDTIKVHCKEGHAEIYVKAVEGLEVVMEGFYTLAGPKVGAVSETPIKNKGGRPIKKAA